MFDVIEKDFKISEGSNGALIYHHLSYLLKYVVLHQKIHLVLGLLLKIVWTLFVIERISQSVKNKYSSISQISLSVFAFFEKNNSVDHKSCEIDIKIHWG